MLAEPTYDEHGLVPCIVQDATTDAVLMLAWMNAEALRLTRETRAVHFWSRSRKALWRKGETSGHTLTAVEIRLDCDLDVVLVRARPAGPTCHTGATSCFFHRDADGDDATDDGPPPPILQRLEPVIAARPGSTAEKSYTKSLLDAGMPKILAKIAERSEEHTSELQSR